MREMIIAISDATPYTDEDDQRGRYDDLGRRVVLYKNHPAVRNASRKKLIELAKEISGESGPFNFCIGHPMRR